MLFRVSSTWMLLAPKSWKKSGGSFKNVAYTNIFCNCLLSLTITFGLCNIILMQPLYKG